MANTSVALSDAELEALELKLLSVVAAVDRDLVSKILSETRRARQAENEEHRQVMETQNKLDELNGDLTNAEHSLVLSAVEWTKTRMKLGFNQSPSREDVSKSALFRRLRDGKAPLTNAPPTNYGYPWYALVDTNQIHRVKIDLQHADIDKVGINGCQWSIIDRPDADTFVVSHAGLSDMFILWDRNAENDVWRLRKLMDPKKHYTDKSNASICSQEND